MSLIMTYLMTLITRFRLVEILLSQKKKKYANSRYTLLANVKYLIQHDSRILLPAHGPPAGPSQPRVHWHPCSTWPVRPSVDDCAGHGEHTFGSSSGLYVSIGQAKRQMWTEDFRKWSFYINLLEMVYHKLWLQILIHIKPIYLCMLRLHCSTDHLGDTGEGWTRKTVCILRNGKYYDCHNLK